MSFSIKTTFNNYNQAANNILNVIKRYNDNICVVQMRDFNVVFIYKA